MGVPTEVWAAAIGAIAGALLGYSGSVASSNRTERAQVHARLAGIKRLMAHLTYSMLEAQVQMDIFQAIRKVRALLKQSDGDLYEKAIDARNRSAELNLEIERLKQPLFEALARIPFLFDVHPGLKNDIADLLTIQEGSVSIPTPVLGLNETQLWQLEKDIKERLKELTVEQIERPLEKILERLGRQLPASPPTWSGIP